MSDSSLSVGKDNWHCDFVVPPNILLNFYYFSQSVKKQLAFFKILPAVLLKLPFLPAVLQQLLFLPTVLLQLLFCCCNCCFFLLFFSNCSFFLLFCCNCCFFLLWYSNYHFFLLCTATAVSSCCVVLTTVFLGQGHTHHLPITVGQGTHTTCPSP